MTKPPASEFLNRFAVVPGIEKPAALSYVKIADWEKEIRIVIEPSNLFPGQLFLTWDSQFEASQDWDTFVLASMTVMETGAHLRSRARAAALRESQAELDHVDPSPFG